MERLRRCGFRWDENGKSVSKGKGVSVGKSVGVGKGVSLGKSLSKGKRGNGSGLGLEGFDSVNF